MKLFWFDGVKKGEILDLVWVAHARLDFFTVHNFIIPEKANPLDAAAALRGPGSPAYDIPLSGSTLGDLTSLPASHFTKLAKSFHIC